MEKIKITDAVVVSSILGKMPIATENQNGLMPRLTYKSPFYSSITLENGMEKEMTIGYGFCILWCSELGFATTFTVANNRILISNTEPNSLISTTKDTPSKICIYKPSEYKFCFQNNLNRRLTLVFSLI